MKIPLSERTNRKDKSEPNEEIHRKDKNHRHRSAETKAILARSQEFSEKNRLLVIIIVITEKNAVRRRNHQEESVMFL